MPSKLRMNRVVSLLHEGLVLHLGSDGGEGFAKNVLNNICDLEVINVDITGGDICGDAEMLPFKNNCFNHVFAGEIIEHVSNIGLMLDESKRTLKPGGTIIITTPNSWHWLTLISRLFALCLPILKRCDGLAWENEEHVTNHTRQTITQLLRRHGFKPVFYNRDWENDIIVEGLNRVRK